MKSTGHFSAQCPASQSGFTLIEIMVVIGLISIIAAVAIPQLAPVIAFSNHEGAARRLAGYGRSAMGHASLMHEKVTVRVDLGEQEYWAVRWIEPESEKDKEERLTLSKEEEDVPESTEELMALAQENIAEKSEDGGPRGFGEKEKENEKVNKAAAAMYERFNKMGRQAVLTRAKNVMHDRSVLDKRDGRFEDQFGLDDEKKKEPEAEVVVSPLLQRTRLKEGIVIDAIQVGEEQFNRGLVDIDITPLGLAEPVGFHVANPDGEYFTVKWDPLTGATRVIEGREPLDE